MVRVHFTPQLRRHIDCPDQALVAATTVREALEAVFARHPGAKSYVLDDQGALRKHVAVFVDGAPLTDRRTLADRLSTEAEIHVLQALSGG